MRMTPFLTGTARSSAPRFFRQQHELEIAVIRALGVGDREHEAFAAVEPPAAQDVSARESPQPVPERAAEAGTVPALEQHRRAGTGITVDLFQRFLQARHRLL